jgi:lipoprotein NlpD
VKKIVLESVAVLLLVGCETTVRKPDRIEVLYAQPVAGEHIVGPGETINKVAQLYNMDPARLVAINNLSQPYQIYVGQKLKVDNEDSDMIIVKQIFYH